MLSFEVVQCMRECRGDKKTVTHPAVTDWLFTHFIEGVQGRIQCNVTVYKTINYIHIGLDPWASIE